MSRVEYGTTVAREGRSGDASQESGVLAQGWFPRNHFEAMKLDVDSAIGWCVTKGNGYQSRTISPRAISAVHCMRHRSEKFSVADAVSSALQISVSRI